MDIISRIRAHVVRTCTKATVAEEAHVKKRRVTWGPNKTRTIPARPKRARPKRVTSSEEMEQAVSEQALYLIMDEVHCMLSFLTFAICIPLPSRSSNPHPLRAFQIGSTMQSQWTGNTRFQIGSPMQSQWTGNTRIAQLWLKTIAIFASPLPWKSCQRRRRRRRRLSNPILGGPVGKLIVRDVRDGFRRG